MTVAYGLRDTAPDTPPEQLTDAKLPNLQKGIAQTFDRVIPGIKWEKIEIVAINGKKLMSSGMTSTAVDQDIHNIMIMTFFRGKLFIANFNSTKSAFPGVESEFRRCVQTIVVKE